ncbi:hypothetical protein TcasGA2_TC006399 [Tribolium castaneum]|uniref:Protein sleepless n=1 Tax=Tribolium castaneum TaxID=7070 RepID=D6WWK7_TRICA|nr:PREDICTED: uncharacterized protein LOC103313968 [Tribolium castaneum]EFA08725.1 hypothetical protein TcasGA2_TC006399 [Tribolium castaneum]|eukprot:XP_008196831.1 PREDICTED: uncharacterized protein LOC103313968 [Tribolium castaneum]
MANIAFISILLTSVFCQTLAVEECYVCLDQCTELQVHKCKDDLSNNTKMNCFTIEVILNGAKTVEKGCLPAETAENVCKKVNQISGTTCTTCDSKLCNGHVGENSGGEMVEPVLPIVIFLTIVFNVI